jgi:hypothetical protein
MAEEVAPAVITLPVIVIFDEPYGQRRPAGRQEKRE